MIKIIFSTVLFSTMLFSVNAQLKKETQKINTHQDNNQLTISNAELGTFPYFKTFPNFKPNSSNEDSLTIEQNRVYFFDGKKYFTVDGKVSSQKLSLIDDKKSKPSSFQIVQEFDKVITTLGGRKIFSGKFSGELLKSFSGSDMVALGSANQIVSSGFYGIVEYAIKTPEKEVWIQLQPYSIGSAFYTLLVVEKQNQLLTTNINKQNFILQQLEKNTPAVITMCFATDSAHLLTVSKDEVLNIVQVFQTHADWKIKIEVHNAPVGKPDYTLGLTQKRAEAIKEELVSLGVKGSLIEVKGLGDQKPLTTNDTEKGRLTNTRVEIMRF